MRIYTRSMSRIVMYEILFLLGLLALACCAIAFTGCAAVPSAPTAGQVGTFQVSNTDGGVFEMDTRDGHGFIVMPEGVVDLGTPVKPIIEATPRNGVKLPSPRTVRPESNL